MIVPWNPSGLYADGYYTFEPSGLTLHGHVGHEVEGRTESKPIGFVREQPPAPPVEDDPDEWYAAEVERMKERAPA